MKILWAFCILAFSRIFVDAKAGTVMQVGNKKSGETSRQKRDSYTCLSQKFQETPVSSSSNSLVSPQITAGALISNNLLDRFVGPMKLVGLFAAWYAFNAGYNVYNAYMKKDFAMPWATSVAQLLVGMIYALPLWISGIRALPQLTMGDIKLLFPIALLNAAGHTAAVIAMFQKGGGSFTHVIKASEPVVSTILNFAINKIVPAPFTAMSLLPITYGVAYASTLGQVYINPYHDYNLLLSWISPYVFLDHAHLFFTLVYS